MTALSESALAGLARIKADKEIQREAAQVMFPLTTLLKLYLGGTWEVMESQDWRGFKALVLAFSPIALPQTESFTKAVHPTCFNYWTVTRIANILGCDWAIVAWTFLALTVDAENLLTCKKEIQNL